MRLIALSLLSALALLPATASAQFATEASHVRDGVRWLVLPSANIATSPQGVVRIQMTGIRARVDRAHGILVDGQRYDERSFGGAIEADIAGLSVTSLSIGFTFDGVQGCSGRLGLAVWRVDESMTLSCNSGSAARFTGYSVNGLSTTGVLELQSKIRRLRNAQARAAQEQQTAQTTQSTTAGTPTGGAATTAAGAATGTASPSSGTTASSTGAQSSTSSADAQAAQRAEQARQAEAARVADAQRADAVDQMATGIAGIATGIAGNIADDRRRAAEARDRDERSRAEYRQRVAANFARMPARPTCTNARGTAVEMNQTLSNQLTGAECRMPNGASAVAYTLELRERTKVAVVIRANFWGRVSIQEQSTARPITGSEPFADLWLPPGVYNIFAHSELAGETGAFDLSLQPGRRSWAGGWQMAFGTDIATATADTYTGDIGGALIAFRMGMPIKQGAAVEERATITADLSFSEAITTADLGLRVYVLGKRTAWRPYVQASYGFVSLCSQGCVDSDIFDPDYYYSSGTAMTLAGGLHWYFNPQYAIDLGYFTTSATLDEGPMTLKRFRIGFAMHPSTPLPPR